MQSEKVMEQNIAFSGKLKKSLPEFVPLIGLVAVVIIFAVMTGGQSVSPLNLKILLNQSVILAVIATGATFIFAMGNFDISLGAVTGFSAVIGALVANATGSVLMMFLACMVTAMTVSMLNGAGIALFKLPSFIVTLSMMFIISAIVTQILGASDMIFVEVDLISYDTIWMKIMVLAIVMFIAVFMFQFTKLGRGNKIIGGNPIVAELSGISNFRHSIQSFLISGIGIGFGAFLLLARTSSVSSQTGTTMGFDIIIAIVLGGMPISGGARSKITAAIVGAFTITTLNNGLLIWGMSTGGLQAVRGILFLAIVGLMIIKRREVILPR